MARMLVADSSSDEEEDPQTRRRATKRETRAEATPDSPEANARGSEGEEDEEDGPDSSAKRRRTKGPKDDEPEEQEDKINALITPKRILERDADGYVPGSIVRIACKNFLTYSNVEFRPGPRLNMIIGPNGSGKSSIVCAIAIGLGFPPKLLNRATAIESYVKTGQEKAWVEIELKAKPGQRNPIIKRSIDTKAAKRDAWQLNGKTCTVKAVTAKVKELNVDVSNLCCFLPQDRVMEFTKLNAQDMLSRTQEAAGAAKLAEWHNKLITQKATLRNKAEALSKAESELAHFNENIRTLERDVGRFHERQNAEEELEVIKLAIPFAEYEEKKNEATVLKAARNECERLLAEAEARMAPFRATQKGLDLRVRKLQQAETETSGKAASLIGDVRKRVADLEKLDEDTRELRNQLSALTKDESKRQGLIKGFRTQITKLEEELADGPPLAVDMSNFNRRIHDAKQQIEAVKAEMNSNTEQRQALQEEIARRDRNIAHVERQLQELLDVDQQRFANFRSIEKNTYEAMSWIRQHEQDLTAGCYDPIALAIRIKDTRYTKHIETMLPNDALRTIIAKSRKDFDFLADNINNKNKPNSYFRVNLIETGTRPPLESFTPPWSREELQQNGFDCWAIDAIEGPDDVIAYLCDKCNIHRIPMSLKTFPGTQFEQQSCPIRRFTIDTGMTTIGFSKYGKNEPFTNFRPHGNVKYFRQQVDQPRVDSRRAEVRDLKGQKDVLLADHAQLKDAFDELRIKMAPLEEVYNVVEQEKKVARQATVKYDKARQNLISAQNKLQIQLDKPSSVERTQTVNAELRDKARKRMRAADAMKGLFVRITALLERQTELGFDSCHARSDLQALEAKDADRQNELQEKKEAYNEAKQVWQVAFNEAKEIYEKTQQLLLGKSEEIKNAYRDLIREHGGRIPELGYLHGRQGELDGILETTYQIASGVVDRYEDNKKKASAATTLVETLRKEQEKLQKSLDIVKNQWEPAIKALVENISRKFAKAFSEMSLHGEVRIVEDANDYAKWGIEILVSFRDDELLSPLSSHVNSGGEKSLSTITYLMSLTDSNNAPFCVVDEINQGMDRIYERNMHNQLVRSTCEGQANQYFLLTPKLLAGLDYHQHMRIQVVCNGNHAPDHLDLGEVLRAKRRQSQMHRA